MLKRIRRWALRRKARGLYLRYQEEINAYDCGVELAEHINPQLREMRIRVDDMVAELRRG